MMPPRQVVEALPQNVLLAVTNERHRRILRANPLFLRFISKKNSAATIKSYVVWTTDALGENPDEFLMRGKADPEWAQEAIDAYVTARKTAISARTGRPVRTVTLAGNLAPVRKFFQRNKLLLDWEAILDDLPRINQTADDRAPTLGELRAYMGEADLRSRFVCAALVSMGGRIGAFWYPRASGGYGYMTLKDITLLDFPEGKSPVSVTEWMSKKHADGSMFAAVDVYPGETERYSAFWSVEAVDNFRVYLEARERANERLTEESPATRDRWNARRAVREGVYETAVPVTVDSLESCNGRIWRRTGVKKAAIAGGFKASHGFRKFFSTEGKRMAGAILEDGGLENRVTLEDIELLMGHKQHYNKPRAYLQKVFTTIMPRLLIDETYEERFLRKKEAEEHERFSSEVVDKLRSEIDHERVEKLELKDKTRALEERTQVLEKSLSEVQGAVQGGAMFRFLEGMDALLREKGIVSPGTQQLKEAAIGAWLRDGADPATLERVKSEVEQRKKALEGAGAA